MSMVATVSVVDVALIPKGFKLHCWFCAAASQKAKSKNDMHLPLSNRGRGLTSKCCFSPLYNKSMMSNNRPAKTNAAMECDTKSKRSGCETFRAQIMSPHMSFNAFSLATLI